MGLFLSLLSGKVIYILQKKEQRDKELQEYIITVNITKSWLYTGITTHHIDSGFDNIIVKQGNSVKHYNEKEKKK